MQPPQAPETKYERWYRETAERLSVGLYYFTLSWPVLVVAGGLV